MGADIPAGAAAGSPTDEELLAAARQDDALALEALLVRYQPHLYRFGLRMCGNVLGSPAIETPRGSPCPDVLTPFSQHLEGEIDQPSADVFSRAKRHLGRKGVWFLE